MRLHDYACAGNTCTSDVLTQQIKWPYNYTAGKFLAFALILNLDKDMLIEKYIVERKPNLKELLSVFNYQTVFLFSLVIF